MYILFHEEKDGCPEAREGPSQPPVDFCFLAAMSENSTTLGEPLIFAERKALGRDDEQDGKSGGYGAD
jgi:hypothetical protein